MAGGLTRLVVLGLVCVSGFGGSSCGRGVVPGAPVAVSDSAGIEIVNFDLDQVEPYGTLEPQPDWVFGESPGRSDGVPLTFVTNAIQMSDGRVAVVNWSTQEIFLADPASNAWERLTGRGGGPGELDFIQSISEEAGTVGVHDAGHRRWMTYRDGKFVESRELPAVGTPGLYFPDVVIPDGDGFYVGDAYVPPGSPGGVVIRRRVLVARVEGGVVDTLAIIPGDTGVDKVTGVSPFPWGASYAIAKADSGLWVGDSDLREMRYWSRGGELQRIVRWTSSEDRKLTRRRINAYRDRVTEGRPNEYQARIRQNFREMEFPKLVPAWGAAIMADCGLLWISEHPGPESAVPFRAPYPALRWWAIDANGQPAGRLETPAGLQVTALGSDHLIGIYMDSLNVETVRRYRINERNTATERKESKRSGARPSGGNVR